MALAVSQHETASVVHEATDGGALRGSETPTTVSEDVVMEDAVHEETPNAVSSTPLKLDVVPMTPTLQHEASPQEATKTRSSRFRGVCWNKKNRRWQSAINNSGKYIYLGSFTSDVDAARAFDLAALQIRGRNTKLNFSVDEYPESQWKEGAPPHLAEKYTSGAARPKVMPFRQFTAMPIKKLHPSNYATIQVPIKRSRYEENVFGKRAFDRAEQSFLSASYPVQGMGHTMPKIKQEFPQAPTFHQPPFQKPEVLGTPFDKNQFILSQIGMPANAAQPAGSVKIPSITTFEGREKDVLDKTADLKGRPPLGRPGIPDHFDDSAEHTLGLAPAGMGPIKLTGPIPQLRKTSRSDRLPVPNLQTAHDDPSLRVSSVIPESVSGSEIEEAKVIVGSSRNIFGLIHRTAQNSRWNALVYDGTTMHSMGVYASDDDAQVASSSAVRLVETIMTRNST